MRHVAVSTLVPSLLALLAVAPGVQAAEGLVALSYGTDGRLVASATVAAEALAGAAGASQHRFEGSLRAQGRQGTCRVTLPAGVTGRVAVRGYDRLVPGGWSERAASTGSGTQEVHLTTTPGEPLAVVVTTIGTSTIAGQMTWTWSDAPGVATSLRTTPAPAASAIGVDWSLPAGWTRQDHTVHVKATGASPDQGGLHAVTTQGDWIAVVRLPTGAVQAGVQIGTALIAVKNTVVTATAPTGTWTAFAPAVPAQAWLRLRRDGPSVVVETGADGSTWVPVGRYDDVALPAMLRVGLRAWGSGTASVPFELRMRSPLGANLHTANTWYPTFPFINLVQGGCGPALAVDASGNTVRATDPATGKPAKTETEAPLDEAGWPTSDFGFKGPYNQPPEGLRDVPLELTFTGQAEVILNPPNVEAAHLSATPADASTGDAGYVKGYHAGTNRSKWYLRCTATEKLGYGPRFVKTQRTPSSPVGSGLTDIALMAPGFTEKDLATHLFNPLWVEVLKPTRVLRMMDWGEMNHSVLSQWNDRVLPGQRAGGHGHEAVEHQIALANATGCDLWLNIPALADVDYVRQLLTTVRDGSTVNGVRYAGLRPDLNLYLEYSNEIWNATFGVSRQLSERLEKLLPTKPTYGPKKLALDAVLEEQPNEMTLRYRMVAGLWATTYRPLLEEFFPGQVATRIRPLLPGWVEFPQETGGDALAWLAAAGWNPQDIFYGIGGSGYFGSRALAEASGDDGDLEDLPAPQVMSGYRASSINPVLNGKWRRFAALAEGAGLRVCAYESGAGIGKSPSVAVAQMDASFTTTLVAGYNQWLSYCPGITNWFSFGFNRYGFEFGDYVIAENERDLNQPRWQAINAIGGASGTPPLHTGLPAAPGLQIAGIAHLRDITQAEGLGLAPSIPPKGSVALDYTVWSDEAQTLDLHLVGRGPEAQVRHGTALLGRQPLRTGPGAGLPVALKVGYNHLTLTWNGEGQEVAFQGLTFTTPGSTVADAPLLVMTKLNNATALEVAAGGSAKLAFLHTGTLSARIVGGPLQDQHLKIATQDGTSVLTVSAPGEATGEALVEVIAEEGGVSRRAVLPILLQPPSPAQVQASPHAQGIALRWTLPEGLPPGRVVIERRPGHAEDDRYTAAGMVEAKPGPQEWIDEQPQGLSFSYRLRLVMGDLASPWDELRKPTASNGSATGLAVSTALRGATAGDAGPWSDGTGSGKRLSKGVYTWSGLGDHQGLDTLTFWLHPVAKNFSKAPVAVPPGPYGTISVAWAATPQGPFTAVGEAREIGGKSAPVTRRGLSPLAWAADLRGLGIPAQAKALQLTVTPKGDRAPYVMEIQAFGPVGKESPTLTAKATWEVQPTVSFFTRSAPSLDLHWTAAPANGVVVGWTADKTFTPRSPSLTLAPGEDHVRLTRQEPTKPRSTENPDFEPGKTYQVRLGVAEKDSVRWGPAQSVTLPTSSGAAAPPNGLQASMSGPRTVRLTWTAVSGATAYKVERAETPDFHDPAGIAVTTSPEVTDASAPAFRTLYYRVGAVLPTGDGRFTDPVSVTTPHAVPAVGPLRASPIAGGVQVAWDAPVGPLVAYEVLIGQKPDHLTLRQPHTATAPGLLQPTVDLRDLAPGTWHVAVRAVGYDLPGLNLLRGTPSKTLTIEVR